MGDHLPDAGIMISPPPGEVEAARARLTNLADIFAEGGHVSPLLDRAREKDLRTTLAALSTTQAERDAAIARAEAAEAEIDMANGAMAAVRKACAAITGENCTFIDDDVARALLKVRARAEAAERDLAAVREGLTEAGEALRPFALQVHHSHADRDNFQAYFRAGAIRNALRVRDAIALFPTPSQPSTDDEIFDALNPDAKAGEG